jgi:hypothetical protein
VVPKLQRGPSEVAMAGHPQTETTIEATGCCPRFDPAPWQDAEITWTDEPFVVDHVRSVLHVPLDIGKRVTKSYALIEAAGAAPAVPLMLSDEKSAWGANIFIHVTKPVPGARMGTLSGRFLTHVYEGPYRDAPRWAADMRRRVAARGDTLDTLYFAYTMCPACARAYGQHYVVLFAKVAPRREGAPRGEL